MVTRKKKARTPASKAKKTNAVPKKSKPSNRQAANPTNDPFPQIQAIIARQLKKKPGEIRLDANLQADLAADSLDAMEIVFQLEETFKLQIAEEDAGKMVTVRDIVAYVARKR